jgi:hypothetical protein
MSSVILFARALGREEALMAYRIKDNGYATNKKIYYEKDHVGWVYKTDTGWRGIIGKTEVLSETEKDAFEKVLKAHTGQSISDIPRNIDRKKVQVQTEIILDFLKDNSAAHGGKLSFANNDVAVAIGKTKPDRPLGNLISRLDFACYRTGLPS